MRTVSSNSVGASYILTTCTRFSLSPRKTVQPAIVMDGTPRATFLASGERKLTTARHWIDKISSVSILVASKPMIISWLLTCVSTVKNTDNSLRSRTWRSVSFKFRVNFGADSNLVPLLNKSQRTFGKPEGFSGRLGTHH